MTTSYQDILAASEKHLASFFQQNVGGEFVFHDFLHTRSVVEAATELSAASNLDDKSIDLLQLAAWFHDSGYDQGAEGHEERSARHARSFLAQYDLPKEDLDTIARCILATKTPSQPKDLLGEILCDADLSHLGKKSYWDRCGRIRQELLLTKSMVMSEQEWVTFELEFMNRHRYFTPIAEQLYNERKLKHIKQLRKQQLRLNPKEVESVGDLARQDKVKKKRSDWIAATLKNSEQEIKQLNLGRGVETMYRTAYRTHINLSAIADNKANIMLSINAIVISIALPQLVPKIEAYPNMLIPTVMLVTICIVAIVLATLSTRPKITEGKFTREDIE
ncbi:MAG: HD domain-containing protein, partial [Bacteroidota bacterium]